jgi:hypothetical protein
MSPLIEWFAFKLIGFADGQLKRMRKNHQQSQKKPNNIQVVASAIADFIPQCSHIPSSVVKINLLNQLIIS